MAPVIEVSPQKIETLRPKLAVSGEPRVEIAEPPRVQRVDPLLGSPGDLDEAGFSEDPEVTGNRGLRKRGKGGDQLSRRPVPTPQQIQHPPSERIGDRREDRVARHVHRPGRRD